MAGRASVVVFDVNEASSDMGPLRGRLEEVGAPGHPRDTWFAGTLRDGCALTAAGEYAEFAAVAKAALRVVLSRVHGLRRELDDAASYVLAGFPELEGHPDVPDGMRMLHQAGGRLVTLTNGSADLAAGTFARAGVLDLLERRMSVSEPRCWKPTPAAYHFAARVCGVPIEQMALVAVHPWDNDGATRAGMTTGWIDRTGSPYPDSFLPGDVTGRSLPAVAAALLAL
jgi:2-haloacid dehalogenase